MTHRTREFEQQSCAATLSDMEMFIFPNLIYSLVLANIMSPRIWAWRDDPWFSGLERMKPYRRITRLKQYIMDHYAFNLDLDTWGLTTKEREMARFSAFISADQLAQSNALFGYEGDKYYFDIDIRTHFGLDKYTDDTIPYWKTETVEAMDAFVHKDGYHTGAGECVSLATLYAAALFVIARIPLDDIYLMATPLHSQNFVDLDDGILTNNRRLVTKNMWFNGTALSAQARRALENERVTIVAHSTGVIHTLYDRATMDPARYQACADKLRAYLVTPLTSEILGSFLRQDARIQTCFQLRWDFRGTDRYIRMERVFAYEQNGPYLATDRTRTKLMDEIDAEEFEPYPLPSRIILNDLEDYVSRKPVDLTDEGDIAALKQQFASSCLNAEIAIESLVRFCRVQPRLPDAAAKTFERTDDPLGLDVDMDRDEIIERLQSIRDRNPMADLAFHALRDLAACSPEPFLAAAVERSAVSITATRDLSADQLIEILNGFAEASIYDGATRLAQPDEVWNYRRGDGIEKALLLGAVLVNRDPDVPVALVIDDAACTLTAGMRSVTFPTMKKLAGQRWEFPVPAAPIPILPVVHNERRNIE